jgi:hypothetical protein
VQNQPQTTRSLRLVVQPGDYSMCRVQEPRQMPPLRFGEDTFFAMVRTADELSVICPEDEVREGTHAEHGWRVLQLEGVFAFTEVGVLAALLQPLAQAGVGILAASTFNTDYVLVKGDQLQAAIQALRDAGYTVLD